MFTSMKIVKMGNYVRICSVRLKNSSTLGEAITQHKIYEDKQKCNLIRAKNKITELALSNDFCYFFTLTFNTSYDRFNLSDLRRKFSYVVSSLRNSNDFNLKYLIVPEQHKNGAWHFHGFLTSDFSNFFYTNDYGYISIKEFEILGFHNIQVIQSKERISSYVTKYVSKNLANGVGKFNHSYFCSLGLNKGQELCEFIYNNEYFNNMFFTYKNDFCYKRVMLYDEFKKYTSVLRSLQKYYV